MGKGIFVVGTDTDVGKTFISSLIVKELRKNGINAGYYKGVLSGAREESNKLIPGDAEEVFRISGLKADYTEVVSYSLKNPYSPHLAARIEGVNIGLDKIRSDYKKVSQKYDYVIVEGSGGIICPIIIEDNNVVLLEDIIKLLKLPTILIARADLGTINHTTLTVKYLDSIGIEVKAIILNGYNPQSIIHRDNKETIRLLTGINTIFEVPTVDEKNFCVDKLLDCDMLVNLINE